jgi:hypothetical protein
VRCARSSMWIFDWLTKTQAFSSFGFTRTNPGTSLELKLSAQVETGLFYRYHYTPALVVSVEPAYASVVDVKETAVADRTWPNAKPPVA